jgi:hypothetical protein
MIRTEITDCNGFKQYINVGKTADGYNHVSFTSTYGKSKNENEERNRFDLFLNDEQYTKFMDAVSKK